MRRKLNVLLIIIFVLCITLPYLFAHRDREGRASSMENRTLAKYPAIILEDGSVNKGYFQQFEDWINDNLRGRTVMVEANSMLQYTLFNRIVKSDTMEGKERWLFVNDPDMILDYQNLNLLSEQELKQYATNMQGISDYLEEKGISFYYFQCYTKSSIYPEKYVDGINKIGTISKADQIVNILQEETDVEQILVKEPLLEHADELVYFQYVDSLHWNEKGSYIGYQVLMNELQNDFPQIRILQENDFDIMEEERTVDLYGYEYPMIESCPVYRIIEPQAVEITEETQERWSFLHCKEHTHVFENPSSENDLKILLLGDSFIRMFLKDDIAESFSETLSIDWLNIPILDEIVEEYQPDIVIIESAQSALKNTVELVNEVDYIE